MAVEQVGLALSMDLSAANREIAKTRESALTLGGGLEKIDRASMAAAKGIGAMGPALGTLSRSSSEALRGIGDIAGLIGPGGGLAIGLTVAVAGVMKLHQAWSEYSENAKIAQQATDAILPALKRLTDDALKPGADALARMRRELAEFGTSVSQREREAAANTVSQLESRLENVRRTGRLEGVKEGFGNTMEDQEVLKIAAARAVVLEAALAEARMNYEGIVQADMALDKARAESDARAAATGGSGSKPKAFAYDAPGAMPDELDEGFARRLEAQQSYDEARRNLRTIEAKREIADAVKIAEMVARIEEKAADDRLEKTIAANNAIKSSWDGLYGGTQQAILAGSLNSFQGFLDAKIAGEENAEQKALAAFLKGTGSQLVGIGTKAVFEGLAISANPLTPGLGAPLIGVGAGAIAAGLAMGAGGAAIAPKESGGGGSAAARREPGINRGSRGGSGGRTNNEATVINVTYSAAGPRPEDTGREVDRALRTHYRRTGGRLG